MPGACVTNDEKLAAKLMKLRVHGMEPKYYHEAASTAISGSMKSRPRCST